MEIHAFAYLAGSSVFTVKVIRGEFLIAAAIPLLGIGLNQLGTFFNSEKVHDVGMSIMVGSLLSIPGALVGYGINHLGKTRFTQIAACFAAAEITLSFSDYVKAKIS
jgi:hypothetical protein